LTIGEIMELTGIHRNAATKALYALERQGKILMTRQVGAAKLYTVKKKD
jgi:hypothetical protein